MIIYLQKPTERLWEPILVAGQRIKVLKSDIPTIATKLSAERGGAGKTSTWPVVSLFPTGTVGSANLC